MTNLNNRKISVIIINILNQKGISIREFAIMMNKPLSEVSKWFVGNHNLNLKLISKIEAILGEEIMKIGK